MPVLAFETITPEQALALSSVDSLTISSGPAKATTVLYLTDGGFSVTVADRTVIFNAQFANLKGSRLTYSDGSQLFVGSAQDDTQSYAFSIVSGGMYGGSGADTLTGGRGEWLIQGNQGADKIGADYRYANVIYGGQDGDNISFVADPESGVVGQFAQGNKGADTIQGAVGGDTLLGGRDDDSINGGGGEDFINGNLGDDRLYGGGRIYGEAGNDRIDTDADVASTVSGGDGNDYIVTGSRTNVPTWNLVYGDAGNDTLVGDTSTTGEMHGGDGADRIAIIQDNVFGAVSNGKLLDGGAGDDTIVGRSGSDTLQGGDGDDNLASGNDADTLDGGSGADTLSGGDGGDVFVFVDPAKTLSAEAADRVLDWEVGDHIRLPGPATGYIEVTAEDFGAALSLAGDKIASGSVEVVAVQVGPDVIIFADATAATAADKVIVLVGRGLADVSADSFI